MLRALFVLTLLPVAAGAEPLTPDQHILHALNRLGYGPRPGDIERVRKMGVSAYIAEQLHPETIADDDVDKHLAPFSTLRMAPAALVVEYWADVRRFVDRQMADGKAGDLKLRYGIEVKANTTPTAATPGDRPALRVIAELQRAKIVRALYSRRQLNEVLVDFWTNHFNIDIKKHLCRALKAEDDRTVIRPHVWGTFRELLGASARSPAMLVYLDNAENSVARDLSPAELEIRNAYRTRMVGDRVGGAANGHIGPNENYGRELLELHTLGVDGGYTQKDVEEVARAFSGWTLDPLSGTFLFLPRHHDDGAKTILGHTLPAHGGIADGEAVLDLLAAHPSTARFIAKKLCQRLVADTPPPALVERIANVFTTTGGDLRKVVTAIVTSPEFNAPEAYRSKVKSPFELAVSAARAVAADTVAGDYRSEIHEGAGVLGYGNAALSAAPHKSLAWSINDMGQPLFAFAAPTGYSEVTAKWVSPSALISRLNFAVAFTDGSVSDVRLDPHALVGGVDTDKADAVLERLSTELLHGELGAKSRAVLVARAMPAASGTVELPRLLALLIGSPEFQRH